MNDPYMDFDNCVDRLLDVYNEHGKLIVGFDFDDTIYDYHKKGHKYPKVIELLQRCSKLGFMLILLTCKETSYEMEIYRRYAEDYFNLKVPFVNYSPVLSGSKKTYVNILLDDKAGLSEAYDILNYTIGLIELSKGQRNEHPSYASL